MKASVKIRPAKLPEPRERRPKPKDGVRQIDVSRMTQASYGTTPFVSLPEEPWTKDATE